MKKLIKNSELLKDCMIIGIAAVLCIVSIIYFAQSYSFYQDEYGTDISFDSDTIVIFLCSVSVLIYGILCVVAQKKNKSADNAYYLCFGVTACLVAFYPLGTFFKALSKGSKFIDCQDYLYIGILGLIMIAYLIFSYLSKKRESE